MECEIKVNVEEDKKDDGKRLREESVHIHTCTVVNSHACGNSLWAEEHKSGLSLLTFAQHQMISQCTDRVPHSLSTSLEWLIKRLPVNPSLTQRHSRRATAL